VSILLNIIFQRGEKYLSFSSYRQITDPALRPFTGDSPVLGQHIVVYKEGPVKMGDEVFVGI